MTQAAIDRLLASREQMRQALLGIEPPTSAAQGDTAAEQPPRGMVTRVLGFMRRAWERHPWRDPTTIANLAATRLLADQGAQHPLRLVAIAAGCGALLIAVRPWRRLGPPLLLAAIQPLVREGFAAALTGARAYPAGGPDLH